MNKTNQLLQHLPFERRQHFLHIFNTFSKNKWAPKEALDSFFKKYFSSIPHQSTFFLCPDSVLSLPVIFKRQSSNSSFNQDAKKELLFLWHQLGPWKKGPFLVEDLYLEAEWRCFFKWERLYPLLQSFCIESFYQKKVLDLGGNNGFFSFKLATLGFQSLFIFDPVWKFFLQFQSMNQLLESSPIEFYPFGFEELIFFPSSFSLILAMGLLYHHQSPLDLLKKIYDALEKEGAVILETIGQDAHNEEFCLYPKHSYAGMKNVSFFPSKKCLENWLTKTGFKRIEWGQDSITSFEEQGDAPYHTKDKKTLQNVLTFCEKTFQWKTTEGYKRPIRYLCKAYK